MLFNKPHLSLNKLPFVMALYYTLVVNIPIVRELWKIVSELEAAQIGFVVSIPLFFFAAFYLIFHLFNWPRFSKIFYVFLLLSSSIVSYTMYNYGIFVDYGMIENLFETNTTEASNYISAYSVIWFALMGGIPALLLAFTSLEKKSWKNFLGWKLIGMTGSMLVISIIAALYYQNYASVGRNNHYLLKMIIPTAYVGATAKYINNTYIKEPQPYQELGLDAKQTDSALSATKPTLLVFVLGETARVYNYEYYGYKRETNAYTKPYEPVFFSNVQSCGTATAVSVPCMFSNMNRSNYDKETAYNQDNVVDIMTRAGVQINWREHDGGDKGVAHKIRKMALLPHDNDHLCNSQVCYDTAMLEEFDSDTKNLSENNVLFYHIVGSHGPTYYKRYPKEHRRFIPDCPRADIENCTHEQLVNSYDNSILFTDYFLSQIMSKLEQLQDKYNVALIYVSDHGESLGENGVYLHGMPYSFAPKEQTHVPMIFWSSNDFATQKNLNVNCLREKGQNAHLSHDNIFDSLLGIMDVQTSEYRKDQDLFAQCRQ
ncbi:phosphoethanolamine transferase [Vibrio pelagius]|uniref:phosphoethanolamine transferase n=1 Tax=Vibrio pelagius TaxID=28169 RepID=UPI0021C4C101|nr:phosphoethanolamine--lipid A transferase [Vibrio pelagius]